MLLAPPLCWSCRAVASRGSPLCSACRRRLCPAGSQTVTAGLQTGTAGSPSTSAPGPRFTPAPCLQVAAAFLYEGPARDLVRALKFRGALGLADPMAATMVASAPEGLLRGHLVPVPLHAARRRRRGFNQAERLAHALGDRTGLPVADCLVRGGPERRQLGRARGDRLAAPDGSVVVAGGVPSRALLVDDVVTTGATLRACAGALQAAGADDVEAFVFARTPAR